MADQTSGTPSVEERTGQARPDTQRYQEVLYYERMPAGFWIRFWAYLVDLLVVASLTSIVAKPVFLLLGIETANGAWYAPYAIVSAIFFYGYFVLMTKFFSQTVGKMIFGIRVFSLKEEGLSWGTLLFREWIGRFLSVTILPLYWIVGFTRLKQGVHDFIADTTVIHEAAYQKHRELRKPHVDGSELQETRAF